MIFIFSYVQIQEHIAYHTEIPADKQLIISFRQLLKDIVGERTKVEDYPKTVLKHHILVFEKENYDNRRMQEPELRECSTLSDHEILRCFKPCF